MRRVAAVVALVSVLASAVGAESVYKAVQNANLPKGSVTVQEIENVIVEASIANPTDKSMQDLAYAIH